MTQLALQPVPAPPRAKPRLVALEGGAESAVPAARAATAPAAGTATALASGGTTAPAAGPTLDALLCTVFAAVSAGAPAACPVCDGRMEPRWTAGVGAIGGRCADCGTCLD